MPSVGSISSLTCTIFVPANFSSILRKHVFHISSTRLKHSIMGNCLNFGLKIAHRLSQGQEKVGLPVWLACLNTIFVHYYSFFLFLAYGIKTILLVFSGLNKKCSQIKKMTCNRSFSELTSHTMKQKSLPAFSDSCRQT